MTWPLRFVEVTPFPKIKDLRIGDLFFANCEPHQRKFWPYIYSQEHLLSDYYKEIRSERPPLLVILPGQVAFCVDAKNWNHFGLYDGWRVTGEIPKISIDGVVTLDNVYSGTIRNGIIADDFLNRQYNEDGSRAFYVSS